MNTDGFGENGATWAEWVSMGGAHEPTSLEAAGSKSGSSSDSSREEDPWRHLTYAKQSQLRREMEKVPKASIAFNIQPLVADAESLAQDIAHALGQAGFKLEDGSSNQPLPPSSGIRIISETKEDHGTAGALARALTKLGFPAKHEKHSSRKSSGTIWIDIGRA